MPALLTIVIASGQLRHSRNQLFPEAQDPPLLPRRVNRVKQELDEHNSEMSLHLLEDDIPPAWVRESDNDLRMDMKMMIIDSQSLPENIHAVVFINDNHTARLLGGSGKLPIF